MKFVTVKNYFTVLCCLVLVLSLTACPKKKLVKKTADETAIEETEDVSSEELDIHGKDFVNIKDLQTVHFEYDSHGLSATSRQTIASNANYLKKNPDFEILVEGHCDERGTIGYNLALGQKRAQAVKKYYISLGIKAKRIGSLSFGEEKQLCNESSEACWAQNRRAETKVRAPKLSENHKTK